MEYSNQAFRDLFYPDYPLLWDDLCRIHDEAYITTDLERWGALIFELVKIHAKMVGCKNLVTPRDFHSTAMKYIRDHATSPAAWRTLVDSSEKHLGPIRNLSAYYRT